MSVHGNGKSKSKSSAKQKTSKTKKQRPTGSKDGLNPKKYSRIKQEYHDIDYANKLNDSEKEWLGKFMFETLGANVEQARFTKTKKRRKEVFDANNARNRDIYSVSKARNRIIDLNSIMYNNPDTFLSGGDYEEELIAFIDSKKVKRKN